MVSDRFGHAGAAITLASLRLKMALLLFLVPLDLVFAGSLDSLLELLSLLVEESSVPLLISLLLLLLLLLSCFFLLYILIAVVVRSCDAAAAGAGVTGLRAVAVCKRCCVPPS